MLLAPVLAVMLTLLLAGAISQLPLNQTSTTSPITLSPSGAPQAAPSMTYAYFLPLTIMFVFAIVIVGIAVALLFFREKNLNKN